MSTIILANIVRLNGVVTNQNSIINPSRIVTAEAFGAQTIIRYRSRVSRSNQSRVQALDVDERSSNTVDTIIINETFTSFKARTEDYNAGVYICVPVISEGETITKNLSVDGIIFADAYPSIPTQSAIQYIESRGVVQLIVDSTLAELITLANVDSSPIKYPTRLATTVNINLSSAPANIDGVAASIGDRILVKNQTLGEDNGIYIWNGETVAMTRASDFDTDAEVFAGALVVVTEGTVSEDMVYELSTNNPIDVGVTPLTFIVVGGVPAVTPTLAQVLATGRDADATGLIRTFGSVNVIDINAQILRDNTAKLSVEWDNRVSYDSTEATSIDWGNRTLWDATGFPFIPSLDWQNRQATDSGGTLSIDWNSFTLGDASGISVHWGLRELKDSSSTPALNWDGREAYNAFGSVTLNWDSKSLTASTGLSLNWENKTLVDSSAITSLDWENRKLYNAPFGTEVMDWANSTLKGAWTANQDLILGVASTTTGKLRFLNSATGFEVIIQAGATAGAHYTLTLPTAVASAGQVLTDAAGDGVLSWTTPSSSGWGLTGNAGTVAGTNFVGTTDDVDLVFKRGGVQAAYLGGTGLGKTESASFGINALNPATTGLSNSAFGVSALKVNTTGGQNVAVGYQSMFANTEGNTNTAIGVNSLISNIVGNNNLALGSYAGRFETGSNNLYISTEDVGVDLANVRARALVWGIFDATTPSNQRFQINGLLKITEGSPGAGKVLTSDATGLATWASAPAATLAATLTAGRDVDGTGTINDSSSQLAIDVNLRKLNPALGAVASLNWEAANLWHVGGNDISLDWSVRKLYAAGTTETLDWSSRTLTGAWSIATSLTMSDATNIILNATTGTQIGTATSQKLGFYGATPVVQGASVADATGGATVDAEARAAINALISRIEATGLIATV